jgi:hypothetical protein
MKIPVVQAAPARPAPHLYFVNPLVDFACIGGASLLTFAALAVVYRTGAVQAQWVFTAAALLTWVCNHPHFAATNYRLYQSKENVSQYPLTAFVVPVLVVGGMAASFALPDLVAPYFVKLFLLWSGYHYSGQSVGITCVYARRAGFHIGRLERLALSGFVFGTYFLAVARSESGAGALNYYGISYPTLRLPQLVTVLAGYWMWMCGLVFLLLVVNWCVSNRRVLPPIVLLPAGAQLLWFVVGSGDANFNAFVPFFHSLQYLLIAWSMHLKERMDTGGFEPSRRFVARESLRWGAVLFAVGAFLFWMLPHTLASSTGLGFQLAAPIVLAGVQIHHFFVDGVIWKLKNPKVGSPLLVNLGQLIRPASAQTTPGLPAVLPVETARPVQQPA